MAKVNEILKAYVTEAGQLSFLYDGDKQFLTRLDVSVLVECSVADVDFSSVDVLDRFSLLDDDGDINFGKCPDFTIEEAELFTGRLQEFLNGLIQENHISKRAEWCEKFNNG